ncbi:MAG: PQQ-dependent sugar dehydrogenase, partial [Oleiphilaceae bacterium]|nr:PQQ-dependent sugar dehydrogenase [Oleiphilaceae bacterium]
MPTVPITHSRLSRAVFRRISGLSGNRFSPLLSLFLIAGFFFSPFLVVHAQTEDQAPPVQVSSSIGDFEIEELAVLEYPWGMALLPGDRMLITEKPGRLRIWAQGELSDPVEGLPEVVY